MVIFRQFVTWILLLSLLGACASKMKGQMKDYREVFARGDYQKAAELLEKSDLKKDKKSVLLWHLEKGTISLNVGDLNGAIVNFQEALALIDQLFTKRLSGKAASLLINDASDVFYGASYERSYAHYYLAKAYYLRYLSSKQKLDLQGARASILAWDTYFTELRRNSTYKTVYQTDLMLKVFGGQVHEVSDIRSDKQISLQLYKDALKILGTLGGVYSLFNEKHAEFVKGYVSALKEEKAPPSKLYVATSARQDLEDFLHYKILSLTKEIRPGDYNVQ